MQNDNVSNIFYNNISLNDEQEQVFNKTLNLFYNFSKTIKNPILKLFKTPQSGVYFYGVSGCGKTTLANKICQHFESLGLGVINMHFNDYFADISRLLEKYTYKQIAKKIAQNLDVLCFDEFFIESIADAKILQMIIEELFKLDVFLIITSNFAPDKLFEGGFNRAVVFPAFSNSINKNLCVYELKTKHDYRLNLESSMRLISKTKNQFEDTLKIIQKLELDLNEKITPAKQVNNKAEHLATKIYNYNDILSKPISIKTIMQIARSYHVVCILHFKNLSIANEDDAMRFRDLVDMLYLRNCLILIQRDSSNVATEAISENIKQIFDDYLLSKKEFIRTYSRLNEMASNQYIFNPQRHQKRLWCDKAREFFETL